MGLFGGSDPSDNSNDNTKDYIADAKRSRNSSYLIFIVIIAVYVGYTFLSQSQFCAGDTSTTGRVKLLDGLCGVTEFVFPSGGASEYTHGTDYQEEMVNFYQSSGVQPVLVDLTGQPKMSHDELQAYANDFYDNPDTGLFSNAEVNDRHDEGHFLIVFQADGTSYDAAYRVGTNAVQVIDADAMTIFQNVLNDAFAKNAPKKLFKNVFKEANSKIMGTSRSTTYVIVALAVILVGYMAFNFFKVNKGQKLFPTRGDKK